MLKLSENIQEINSMALSYHQQEEMHKKVTKGKYEIMWVPQKENAQKEDKKTLSFQQTNLGPSPCFFFLDIPQTDF